MATLMRGAANAAAAATARHDRASGCWCAGGGGGHDGARSCRSSYARIRGSHRRRKPAYCGLGRRRGRRTQGLVGHAATSRASVRRWGLTCPSSRARCASLRRGRGRARARARSPRCPARHPGTASTYGQGRGLGGTNGPDTDVLHHNRPWTA